MSCVKFIGSMNKKHCKR